MGSDGVYNTRVRYIIHCDGGARGNPGPAAYGFIIETEDGTLVHREGVFLGVRTNNQAEYRGVIAALRWMGDHRSSLDERPSEIVVFLDSQLLVNQLSGRFKIKSSILQGLAVETKMAERDIGVPVSYIHVRRKENSDADRMVNDALDSIHR